MKKFLLPALVMVFLVSVFLVGVFLYKNSQSRRFAAEKGEEIKVNSEKLKVKSEEESEKRTFLKSYVNAGVTTHNGSIVSVNGPFVGFEPISSSDDVYLKLKLPDKNAPRLRVVYKPDKNRGVAKVTEVSIVRPDNKAQGLAEALRLVGDINKISKDELDFLFRPNIWVSAILYLDEKGNNLKDASGAYYVRAVTVKEI